MTNSIETDIEKEDGHPNLPVVDDALLNLIKQKFLAAYEPVPHGQPAGKLLTTNEIYSLMYSISPLGTFTTAELAKWLHEKGFTFLFVGEKALWQLKNIDG